MHTNIHMYRGMYNLNCTQLHIHVHVLCTRLQKVVVSKNFRLGGWLGHEIDWRPTVTTTDHQKLFLVTLDISNVINVLVFFCKFLQIQSTCQMRPAYTKYRYVYDFTIATPTLIVSFFNTVILF